VPFFDLSESILGQDSAHLFIPDNWHLNARGHLEVATALRRALGGVVAGVDR
jgi:hypothetical protein